MKKDAVLKAAELLKKRGALKARIKELGEHKAAYISVDQETGKGTSRKIGFDAEDGMIPSIIQSLTNTVTSLTTQLLELGVEDA